MATKSFVVHAVLYARTYDEEERTIKELDADGLRNLEEVFKAAVIESSVKACLVGIRRTEWRGTDGSVGLDLTIGTVGKGSASTAVRYVVARYNWASLK